MKISDKIKESNINKASNVTMEISDKIENWDFHLTEKGKLNLVIGLKKECGIDTHEKFKLAIPKEFTEYHDIDITILKNENRTMYSIFEIEIDIKS